MLKEFLLLPRKLVLSAVKLYQKILSPDHGIFKVLFPHGYCKFKPSCSQYSYAAIEKYGVIKGGAIAIWRILRCNPCSRGGIDRVK